MDQLQRRRDRYFNPRTHEECDATLDSIRPGCFHFNPRTHEECDLSAAWAIIVTAISIHALTRSATV